MSNINTEKLLKDQRVVAEINKHKWFESEKVGHDIGFEKAAKDWFNRYGAQWATKNGCNLGCSDADASLPKRRSNIFSAPSRKR